MRPQPPHRGRSLAVNEHIIRGQQWGRILQEQLAGAPSGTLAWLEQAGRPLKTDVYSRVALLPIQGEPCFAKLYLAKSAWRQLAFRLGFSRAARSFDAASDLARADQPVPAARTCLRVPEGLLLITEGIPDANDLRALWLSGPEQQHAFYLLQCAGIVLARLHDAGYAHGDCKWGNLLWNGTRFYLVDLEAVRRIGGRRGAGRRNAGRHLPARGQARQYRDLARFTLDAEDLGVGQAQYDLFLDSYAAERGLQARQLIAAMRPMLEKMRARHAAKYGTGIRSLVS